MSQGLQVEGQGPYAYERFLVPAFFASCAEQLLELAPVAPGQRVLDVACGTGIVARRASAEAGAGGTVAGVDTNAGMIDVARTVPAAEALQRHAGDEATAMTRAPFAWSERDEIRSAVLDAGFKPAAIRIGAVMVRFRSAEEFLHHEVIGSPLAGPVGALDGDRYQALGHDLAQALSPYTDDEGIVLPMQTWLATAWRGSGTQ